MIHNNFKHPISKRFINAFPKFKDTDSENVEYFWETWQNSQFYDANLTEQDLSDIYYHLLAKYYDWHFRYMDDMGISLNVMHIIHDYYPNCKEKLSLVEQMRNLTLDEFKKSGVLIDSQGQNPKVSTNMDELINLVDSQNASFELKSTEQTLKAKFMSLYDGVMEEFIDRFKECFVKLYSGLTSYIYFNDIDEEDE